MRTSRRRSKDRVDVSDNDVDAGLLDAPSFTALTTASSADDSLDLSSVSEVSRSYKEQVSSTWRWFQEPTSELSWKSLDYERRGKPREVRTQPRKYQTLHTKPSDRADIIAFLQRIGRLPANDSAICKRGNSTTTTRTCIIQIKPGKVPIML